MTDMSTALSMPVPHIEQPRRLTHAASAPIITVEQLVKRYKKAERNAVDNISFTVQPGALFALLGPNGAGKTTAISILTTTLAPTSGTVTIAGYDLMREGKQVRSAVGIIFQKPSLDLKLTAEENIRFHAALYGIYPFRPSFALMPRRYREQIGELAAVLGLENDLRKKVKNFSGGMKRKLEIMRSLLHQPKVLFLDEPTLGLDADSRRNLWDYLRQARRQQETTVFLTTHYLEEAEEADDVCVINHGKIVAQGSPAQLKEKLIQAFLLIDAEDRQTLRDELQQLQIPFNDGAQISVPLDDSRSVHSLLRAITTPLTFVETRIPSLEDAYLKIIGATTHA